MNVTGPQTKIGAQTKKIRRTEGAPNEGPQCVEKRIVRGNFDTSGTSGMFPHDVRTEIALNTNATVVSFANTAVGSQAAAPTEKHPVTANLQMSPSPMNGTTPGNPLSLCMAQYGMLRPNSLTLLRDQIPVLNIYFTI